MILDIPTQKIRIQYDDRGGKINPRRTISDTTDLQGSIAQIGQTTPIEVGEPDEDGMYPLYGGESRLTAIRQLYEKTKDARYETIKAIVRSDYGYPRLHMLATGVQSRYKRSEIADSVHEAILDGHRIEDIARVAGLDERDIPAYAALHGAEDAVRGRVDRGDIAWTTWCKLVAHMSKEEQDSVAQMEKPTMKNIKKVLEERRECLEQSVLPGVDMRAEEVIGQLHQVERILREVLLGRYTWPDEYRMRIEYRLETIASMLNQGEGSRIVVSSRMMMNEDADKPVFIDA